MESNKNREAEEEYIHNPVTYTIMPMILCLMMNGFIRLTSGLINDVIELTAKN
jgi:hypothetical protein